MHTSLSTALRICCCLALVFQPALVRACINDYDYRTPEPGTPGATAREYAEWLRVRPEKRDDPQPDLKERAARAQEGTYREHSDYAVALLRAGEYVKGRDILQDLAEKHGDEYIIATNLGTAYELTGDVPNALQWIRKGHQLNPESHRGTEWLHVKILEAKLQAAKDKEWFAKSTTLGLNFGKEAKPVQPQGTVRDEQQKELSLDEVRKALEYQLRERTQFIQDNDPQMSELFLTLGNILALQGEPEKAYEVFKLAGEYDMTPQVHHRIVTYRPPQPSRSERFIWYLRKNLPVTFLLGLILLAIVWYIVGKFRRPKIAV